MSASSTNSGSSRFRVDAASFSPSHINQQQPYQHHQHHQYQYYHPNIAAHHHHQQQPYLYYQQPMPMIYPYLQYPMQQIPEPIQQIPQPNQRIQPHQPHQHHQPLNNQQPQQKPQSPLNNHQQPISGQHQQPISDQPNHPSEKEILKKEQDEKKENEISIPYYINTNRTDYLQSTTNKSTTTIIKNVNPNEFIINTNLMKIIDINQDTTIIKKEEPEVPKPVINPQPSPTENWASVLKKNTNQKSPTIAKIKPITSIPNSTPTTLIKDFEESLGIILLKILHDPRYNIFQDNNVQFYNSKPKGFTNTGNICFMNSILQVLFFCLPFNKLMKIIEIKSPKSLNQYPIIKSTVELFENYSMNQSKNISPEVFYNKIKNIQKFQHLVWGRQEDAEEFLGYYLDALNEEFIESIKNIKSEEIEKLTKNYNDLELSNILITLKKIKKSEGDDDDDDDDEWVEVNNSKKNITKIEIEPTPLNLIFGGEFKSVLTLTKGTKINLDPFQHVQLDLSKSESIEDALIHFNELENINYKNSNNKEIEIKKQTFIEKLPNVLIIHLKRFSYEESNSNGNAGSGIVEKVKKRINYNNKLIIPKELLSNQQQDEEYQLVSVVYHHGSSADAGHYTSDIQTNDQWYRIDDTVIKEINEDEVMNGGTEEENNIKNAYILLYSRI
ncbi:unnamed protein product [Candida verbasci]|uniref:Ubiquitin carboxyl-terminal hydrolase n=1 Tax=Candida verbasci TaxID=1227364 RepID=A0A9W4U0W6_9ASCO|nr:unnamed protein product [Candida verbasci]